MPITYTIDKQKRFIKRTMSDTVTLDEILANIDEVMNHPDYQPGMRSLTDVRPLLRHVSPQDVRQLAHFLIGRGERIRGGRAAVVVTQEVGFGMARMLELLTQNAPLSVGVFKDPNEAYEWLGLEND